MKRTVLLSFLALCLPAVLRAQTPVTITGPINTPEGQPWTGTLSIQNPTVLCGGVKVPKPPQRSPSRPAFSSGS